MRIFLDKFFNELPIGILGLALGISSIGWNVEKLYALPIHLFTTSVALLIVTLVIIKLMASTYSIKQCLSNALIGPILPIIAMTLMIASTHFDVLIAKVIWTVALSIHIIILLSFLASRAFDFKLENVAPTWFIPTIGIVLAPITNPSDAFQAIDQWIIFFAVISYAVLLPLVIYRLKVVGQLPLPNQPALALFAAPPNICLVGYLASFETPSLTIISILALLGITMTLFSYWTVFRLLSKAFSPNFGAFTFPLAIGASAMQSLSIYLAQQDASTLLVTSFSLLAQAQLIVAASITLIVFYRYITHYAKA